MKIARTLLAWLMALSFPFAIAQAKQMWAKSFLNQKAPDLVVEKWLTEKPNYQGKFLLVDFWATWCPPCRRAIPELNELHKKFVDKLVVVGLSNEKEEIIRRMKEPRIDYSIAIDTQQRMQKAAEVKGIPHVLLVDPRGIVRWEGHPLLPGYELTETTVRQIMEEFSE